MTLSQASTMTWVNKVRESSTKYLSESCQQTQPRDILFRFLPGWEWDDRNVVAELFGLNTHRNRKSKKTS